MAAPLARIPHDPRITPIDGFPVPVGRFARAHRGRRFRAETTVGQLAERYDAKRVRARDLWHRCSRLLRKILSHTIAVARNAQQGNEPPPTRPPPPLIHKPAHGVT